MSSSLYDDMRKLNALYQELCWDDDDELVFTHDGTRVIVYNKTQNDNKETNRKVRPTY